MQILGCGDRKIHGFINVDIRPEVKPDLIADIYNISQHLTELDEIYASHVLEHFPRTGNGFTFKDVLKDWYKALKIGGILKIAVPDFQAVALAYLQDGVPISKLQGFLSGGYHNQYDIHYVNFDFLFLSQCLKEVGFEEITKFQWQNTDHWYVDDYSQSYLPHLDKQNGRLMSLNVECKKLS